MGLLLFCGSAFFVCRFIYQLDTSDASVDTMEVASTGTSTSTSTHGSTQQEQQGLKEPWEIVDQYIAWHSHEALQLEQQQLQQQQQDKDSGSSHSHTNSNPTTTDQRQRQRQRQRQQQPQRAYAVAFYSCPHQMGNRMHHFMNSLLWSIVTNRTLVWHYYDKKACHSSGSSSISSSSSGTSSGTSSKGKAALPTGGDKYDSRICNFANHHHDCAQYITRAEWMPSYDGWKEDQAWLELESSSGTSSSSGSTSSTTNTVSKDPKLLSYWSTHSRYTKPGRGVTAYNQSSQTRLRQERQYIMNTNAHQQQQQQQQQLLPVVVFPQMLGKHTQLHKPAVREELLPNSVWAQQTARQLYRYGPDFLYGLLWHSAFSLTDSLIDSTTGTMVTNPNFVSANGDSRGGTKDGTTVTTTMPDDEEVEDSTNTTSDATTNTALSSKCSIALHSRHTNISDVGSDIESEIHCIQHLWSKYYIDDANHLEHQRQHLLQEGCDLFVMTDRPHTLKYLVDWCRRQEQDQRPILSTTNERTNNNNNTHTSFPCRQVIYALHQLQMPVTTTTTTKSNKEEKEPWDDSATLMPMGAFNAEHGPYAGAGFLQDLAVVRQSAPTNIGIVGGKRSSTDLLVEWMEYDRLVDYYDDEDDDDGDSGDGGDGNDESSRKSNGGQRSRERRWRRRRRRLQPEEDRPIAELPRCMLSS